MGQHGESLERQAAGIRRDLIGDLADAVPERDNFFQSKEHRWRYVFFENDNAAPWLRL